MKMENLFDFLEKLTRELDRLDDEGASKAAERIRLAARISSVGLEVIMAVRRELSDLVKSRVHLRAEIRREVQDAINSISYELTK